MGRVTDPLALFGAKTVGRQGGRLPLTMIGAVDPIPVDYATPMASAQVKSAVLLAGLNALSFHARGGLSRLDRPARIQTVVSMGLWLAVIICGRWIAYQ